MSSEGRPQIFIDNREKAPLVFPGYQTRHTTLRYGDYSAWGLSGIFEIERKSTMDMVGTVVRKSSWAAFLKKCDKWAAVWERYRAARVVLVAGNYTDILDLPWSIKNRLGPRGIDLYFNRVALLTQMGISVLYVGDPVQMSKVVVRMLTRELAARERGRTVEDLVYQREPELVLPQLAHTATSLG